MSPYLLQAVFPYNPLISASYAHVCVDVSQDLEQGNLTVLHSRQRIVSLPQQRSMANSAMVTPVEHLLHLCQKFYLIA